MAAQRSMRRTCLFACLLAVDEVFEKAGMAPGEDPELTRMRDRLATVEQERDRLEAALSAATDARGRLERDMRKTLEEAAARNQATHNAQAERIEALETRCALVLGKLASGQPKTGPLRTPRAVDGAVSKRYHV